MIVLLIVFVFCLLGSHNYNKLYKYNQNYYEIIKDYEVITEKAKDIIRELQLKVETYEDILEGKITIELKPEEDVTW